MIRTPNHNDEQRLIEIFHALKQKTPEITGFQSWTDSKFLSELKIAGALVLDDHEIQGFVLYRTIPDGYEVTLLGTDPKIQRRGVMVKILRGLIGLLQKDQHIWLEVHEKNDAARHLYDKLGFKTTGKRPRYYSDGSDCLNLEYKS